MARCGGVARARRLARPPGRRGRRVPVPPRRPRLSAHTGARAYRYSLGRTRPCGVWCSCSEYAIRRSDSIVIGAGVCRGGRIDFAIGIGPIGRARAARLPYGRKLRGAGYPITYTEYARRAAPGAATRYGLRRRGIAQSTPVRLPGAETRPAFHVRRSRRHRGGVG